MGIWVDSRCGRGSSGTPPSSSALRIPPSRARRCPDLLRPSLIGSGCYTLADLVPSTLGGMDVQRSQNYAGRNHPGGGVSHTARTDPINASKRSEFRYV